MPRHRLTVFGKRLPGRPSDRLTCHYCAVSWPNVSAHSRPFVRYKGLSGDCRRAGTYFRLCDAYPLTFCGGQCFSPFCRTTVTTHGRDLGEAHLNIYEVCWYRNRATTGSKGTATSLSVLAPPRPAHHPSDRPRPTHQHITRRCAAWQLLLWYCGRCSPTTAHMEA